MMQSKNIYKYQKENRCKIMDWLDYKAKMLDLELYAKREQKKAEIKILLNKMGCNNDNLCNKRYENK